ncbi:MAG: sensor histidine kinase [Candidatus Saccharibacteria bacterium]
MKNRFLVFKVVLNGTIGVTVALCALLLVSYLSLHNTYVIGRLACGIGALLLLLCMSRTARIYPRYYNAMAWLLVIFYGTLATGIVWSWGINTPYGILLFGLVVILSGILIKARYVFHTAIATTLILIAVQVAATTGAHIPSQAWTTHSSNLGDVFGYSVGFGMIGIISWLYGSQMERSLQKAADAERALEAEKDSLAEKVRQRTAALERTRIKELEQMYRLTEFGSLSTGLLHDLANYLTILTLDIEDLHSRDSSETLDRARQTIQYIDAMVDDVRDQLNGTSGPTKLNVLDAVSEVVAILQHKAHQQAVELAWQAPKGRAAYAIVGDHTRLNQIITILVNNAIDAYVGSAQKPGVVSIVAERLGADIKISVTDTGKGISTHHRQKLFKPFHSSKTNGMGIGLFLAKQMAETHFKGSVELDPSTTHTTFIVTILSTSSER